MKKILKKVLSLTLCFALGLSLVGGAFAADETTETTGNTFDLETLCTDNGQPVVKVIIHLEKSAGDVTAEELKDAFSVTVAGYNRNFYGWPIAGDFARTVETVEVSEDGKTITLGLSTVGNFPDSIAFTSDYVDFGGKYEVKVVKEVGDLTTDLELTYGKTFDPVADKWGAVAQDDEAGTYAYRWFDPSNEYEKPENGYPIIVWLHGAGEWGSNNNTQITANRVTAWGEPETQELFGGAYVIAPQANAASTNPLLTGWNGASVVATIENLIAAVGEENVNRNRIVIGGCSAGGAGTWTVIKAYPEYFAAAFPICTASAQTNIDELLPLLDMPIYMIHTVEDSTCLIDLSITSYNTLKNAGKDDVYLALYEHTWYEGLEETPEAMAGISHFSWIYAHNDFDGEKTGDKFWMDEYTHTDGVTYETTKPAELGYTSFKAWLADQVRDDVYFTREREVVAFGEIVRSVTIHGLDVTEETLADLEIVVTGVDVADFEGNLSNVVRADGTAEVVDGKVVITYPTGMAFTNPEIMATAKYSVTVDGEEIRYGGDSSELIKFGAVTYTTPTYSFMGTDKTTMSARYFTPDATEYPAPAEGYPLIIWLHGIGEMGNDNRLPISGNDVPAWTEKASQDIFGGAYVLAIQNHAVVGENAPAATMSLILQFIKNMGNIDISRVYIGGCSMGGIGTWQMLRNYPNFFAAAYPICCGPSPALTEEEIATLVNVPVYMTVSSGDSSGIVAGMIDAYNQLTAAGNDDVHIAIFEHSAYEGYEALASFGVYIDHYSWTYAHSDYDGLGEDYDGQQFIDTTVDGTYNNGAVVVEDGVLTYTYTLTDAEGNETGTESIALNGKTERPGETGYATFKTWIAAKENTAPSAFKDVDDTTLNRAAILELAIQGLTTGTNKAGTTFKPDATLTRAEFVTFLSRVADATVDNTADTGFDDVPVNSWETGAIAWAVEKGLIVGYDDGTFRPNNPVTEEEVNIIVDRLLESDSNFTAADGQKLGGAATPATRAQIAGVIAALEANHTAAFFWWF